MHRLVSGKNSKEICITVSLERGNELWYPKVVVPKEYVYELLNMGLSVKCIANFVRVSRWTLQRHMNDWGFSVRDLYSDLTDDEQTLMVSDIHTSNPHAGYLMMLELLRVQWQRVCASMHSRHCWNCIKNVRVAVCGTQDILRPRPQIADAYRHKPQTYKFDHV